MGDIEKCKSIKSKNNPFERCPRVACEDGFCKSHNSQKNRILFDPFLLNPIHSENDTDPVSLEKIYEENNKIRKLCQRPQSLFTYVMEIGGKEYQRTLQLTSLQNLLQNNILKDPFSNEPFPLDILQKARKEVSRLPKMRFRNRNEEQKIRMNTILDKFQSIGYYINPSWVSSRRKTFFISWINEVNHLWCAFCHDNPSISGFIYSSSILANINFGSSTPEVISNITARMLEFMSFSMMGVMIVLSGLAWVSEDVKRAYPDLISF